MEVLNILKIYSLTFLLHHVHNLNSVKHLLNLRTIISTIKRNYVRWLSKSNYEFIFKLYQVVMIIPFRALLHDVGSVTMLVERELCFSMTFLG